MTELGDVYKGIRERVVELLRTREDAADTTVPACPDWTVKDAAAHLSGVCDDITTGNLEGVATDPWTSAQVAKRRDWSLAEVLDEWSEKGPQVDPLVHLFPGRVGSQLILDTTTHEHDIRHAVGAPGAKGAEGVMIGTRMLVEVGFFAGVSKRGLPPLEIVAGDMRWVVGTGEPAAADTEEGIVAAAAEEAGRILLGGDLPDTSDVAPAGSLKIEPFELMRALTGRRSADQIRAYDWSVDPEPYLPVFTFGPFRTRPDALEE